MMRSTSPAGVSATESHGLPTLAGTELEPAALPTYPHPAAAVFRAATPVDGVTTRPPSPALADARLKATFTATAPSPLPNSLAVAKHVF